MSTWRSGSRSGARLRPNCCATLTPTLSEGQPGENLDVNSPQLPMTGSSSKSPRKELRAEGIGACCRDLLQGLKA